MNGGGHLTLRFAPILIHSREDAKIKVPRVAFGIDRQKMIQMLASLGEILALNVDLRQRFVGACIPGLDCQRGLELLNRIVDLTKSEIAKTKFEMSSGVGGGELNHSIKIMHRLANLAPALPPVRPKLIRTSATSGNEALRLLSKLSACGKLPADDNDKARLYFSKSAMQSFR